jgi:NAD(P)-dependent dehydrogenase (short-subunit alcohol dehydrogenase family)
MNLKNKIVVITGGSKGLGLSLAKLFHSEGSKVVVCAKEFDCEESGLIQRVCDVTNEEQVAKFVNDIVTEFGGIDIFINNAGVWIPHCPIEQTATSDVKDVFDVNYFGTYFCTKHVVPHFKSKQNGVLLNIISEGALEGRAGSAVYRSSKFAVNGLTKSVRLELENDNVKVLSVFPGRTKTSLFERQMPEDYKNFMDPEEVSKLIIENIKKDNPEDELVIR